MEPEDDEPGLVVVPWFCIWSERSLGDTLWAITGVASRTATAAAVSRRIMRLSFSWRGHLWASPSNKRFRSRFAAFPKR